MIIIQEEEEEEESDILPEVPKLKLPPLIVLEPKGLLPFHTKIE
jgi:hypothetical protein